MADGHELITPEQGDVIMRVTILDGRHGILPVNIIWSRQDALTAEASVGCLPNEAVEKSVNGGLRGGLCRCRFTDHSQPFDETDEYSGGT